MNFYPFTTYHLNQGIRLNRARRIPSHIYYFSKDERPESACPLPHYKEVYLHKHGFPVIANKGCSRKDEMPKEELAKRLKLADLLYDELEKEAKLEDSSLEEN